jgi:hypothetical protein
MYGVVLVRIHDPRTFGAISPMKDEGGGIIARPPPPYPYLAPAKLATLCHKDQPSIYDSSFQNMRLLGRAS